MPLTTVPNSMLTSDPSNASNLTSGSVSAARMPTGSVIQTITSSTNTQTGNSTSTYAASTLTATITPTSSTSKILILTSGYIRTSTTQVSISYTIYRNSATDLFSTFSNGAGYVYTSAGGATEIVVPMNAVDTPATTSATTYTVYFKRTDAAGTAYYGSSAIASTITLLEIKV